MDMQTVILNLRVELLTMGTRPDVATVGDIESACRHLETAETFPTLSPENRERIVTDFVIWQTKRKGV
jgi:hypothetical protein